MENEYSECPVCGNNALDSFHRDLSTSYLRGITKSYYNDPGGVEIRLIDYHSFRLTGMCEVCDFEVIEKEVEEYKKRRINENN